MDQARVVVVGSTNMDLVAKAAVLPRPGETVLGGEFVTVAGGKGANQAIAAVRAGAATRLLGAIGSDAFGVTLKARIDAAGVDTGLLRVVYGASGVALITVDAAGENTIVVSPGANGSFTDLDERERAAIAEAAVMLAQLEIPVETVTAAALAARSAGTRVVLNAAPARALPAELLDAVDLLVVNETEAVAISGESRPEPLLASVPRVVLTLGAQGAWYVDREGASVQVPGVRVETVDSTAAGDAFTGALAVAWAEGRELVEAVGWACAAGAACARKLGASTALPTRAEIDELWSVSRGPDRAS
ncbi:ribokinase [Asanoa ishikariensis]|uniref:Ribokinase n=1 Tax=Asanoa ishikariensis TaxID=137265 RepID=A0A1H3RFR7_9ACTN|nr:ribokinase [Asanoa ishikariensis]SDZ24048.1 ribokinase [Asanoa ishikariensis]